MRGVALLLFAVTLLVECALGVWNRNPNIKKPEVPTPSEPPSFRTPYLTESNFSQKSGIIGVMSSANNFERRMVCREAYQHWAEKFTRVRISYVIGTKDMAPSILTTITIEQDTFQDLALIEDWPDATKYNSNTSFKVVSWYAWALRNERKYDYLIKADHDTYVHPFNLQRLLAWLPTEKVYWGHVMKHWGPSTLVPALNFQDRMDYHSGGLYIISRDIADWIVRNREFLSRKDAAWKGHFYEDKAAGLWASAAKTSMEIGIVDLAKYLKEKPDTSVFKGWRKECMLHSSVSDWYNLDIGSTHAKWYKLTPEKRLNFVHEFNFFAQGGHPPLSTVVAHNVKNHSRYTWLHNYFLQKSYSLWQACAGLKYSPPVCKDLIRGADSANASWAGRPAHFYFLLKEGGYQLTDIHDIEPINSCFTPEDSATPTAQTRGHESDGSDLR